MPPSPPQRLKLTSRTPKQYTLSWMPPKSTGGAAVHHYVRVRVRVRVSPNPNPNPNQVHHYVRVRVRVSPNPNPNPKQVHHYAVELEMLTNKGVRRGFKEVWQGAVAGRTAGVRAAVGLGEG